MSAKGYAWGWERARSLTSLPARYVLLYLVERANSTGRCWPRQETIAEDCGLSVRAVRDALKALETAEPPLIARTARWRGKTRRADLITVLFTAVTFFENGADEAEDDDEDEGVTKSAGYEEPPAQDAGITRQDMPDRGGTTCRLESPIGIPQENPAAGVRAPEGSSLREEGEQKEVLRPGLDVLAARIFDSGTDAHRKKCQGDPRKIEFALRDVERRGFDPVMVTEAMVAMLTSADQMRENGKFAVGPHRAIDDDRWKNWIGRSPGSPPSRLNSGELRMEEKPTLVPSKGPSVVEFEGWAYAVPDGGNLHLVGTKELPGIARQVGVMHEWGPARRTYEWDKKRWGPPPGAEGCRMWPSVLERFPHESAGGQR